jgi:hypothetical protein
VYTLLKKRTIVGVGSLTFVKIEIFSEAHVVSIDVLAPAIEKLMQTEKIYENCESWKRRYSLVSIVLAATTS